MENIFSRKLEHFVKEQSQSLTEKDKSDGAMYAEPVNWSSPKGEKLSGTNVIIRKQLSETILWKLIQRNFQILKVF